MTTTAIAPGTVVTRVSTDYTNGRKGNVIQINENTSRAQVDWEGCPTTWVNFKSLKVEDIKVYEAPDDTAPEATEEEQPFDGHALVGKTVLRKCGTAGKVDAFDGSAFAITLIDGKVKKPGVKLFRKNYTVL